MPQRFRKIRRKRGSRTHGYGRVGQHRCHASRGYRNAGRHKQGWSYVLRYEPDYFGKNGFTSPKSLRQKPNVINVGTLDQMASKFAEEKEGQLFIDLQRLGYTKLLGTGKVTKPLTVKVELSSKSAVEKIKEAGGQVLAEEAQQEGE